MRKATFLQVFETDEQALLRCCDTASFQSRSPLQALWFLGFTRQHRSLTSGLTCADYPAFNIAADDSLQEQS